MVHGPVFGGVHAQVVRLAAPMADRGWELVCLLPDELGTGIERIRVAGVRVVTLPLRRLRADPNPAVHARMLASFRSEVRGIRRLADRESIDLVQVHGPTNPHGAVAAHLDARAVVWQLPDTRAPMALRRLTMPVVTRLADVVTSVGEELARSHPGALSLGERLVPIYPPVDLERFNPDRDAAAAARAVMRVPIGSHLVGTVANLNPSKGHEHLIRAAARIRDELPATSFRIMGAPSPPHPGYESHLREEARALGFDDPSQLDFLDPGDRVPELLPALDVFVVASVPRSEGMPTVLIEAMSCGIPTVATAVGAVSEVVDHGRTGFVVTPESPEALAEAVSRLLRDPELRASMGAAGRRRALDRFGLPALADVHADAYELALEHRRSRGT